MDDIDTILTGIIDRVSGSPLPETEKADVFASMTAGMHRLVWPILLAHAPEYLLNEATTDPEHFTLDDYTELISSSLQNPATAKEMHDELVAALTEVDEVVAKALS